LKKAKWGGTVMKLSVFSVVLGNQSFPQACAYLESKGVQAIEIGCGGNPGKEHCDPKVLLHDKNKLKEFVDTLKQHNLEISALSVHGNPIHPDADVAKGFHDDFCDAVRLAQVLQVKRIVGFSGCPGGSREDKTPNWITCVWPRDYMTALKYQWEEVLIPYWQKMAEFAVRHDVDKIALEMHPGFCVYNPLSLLKLREAVGPVIGANFDPSHLFWQGIDPVMAIREMGDSIFFFHAKDTRIDPVNTGRHGVLDMKGYENIATRSWAFRTIGYGHDLLVWKEIISELRLAGYDGAISIEHEDGLMSRSEGLNKAIEFLKQVLLFESPSEMYWA
jgi:sugar phosphate isomerase/epimerase